MNYFKKHESKIVMMGLGVIVAGFLCDVQWHALARAVGV